MIGSALIGGKRPLPNSLPPHEPIDGLRLLVKTCPHTLPRFRKETSLSISRRTLIAVAITPVLVATFSATASASSLGGGNDGVASFSTSKIVDLGHTAYNPPVSVTRADLVAYTKGAVKASVTSAQKGYRYSGKWTDGTATNLNVGRYAYGRDESMISYWADKKTPAVRVHLIEYKGLAYWNLNPISATTKTVLKGMGKPDATWSASQMMSLGPVDEFSGMDTMTGAYNWKWHRNLAKGQTTWTIFFTDKRIATMTVDTRNRIVAYREVFLPATSLDVPTVVTNSYVYGPIKPIKVPSAGQWVYDEDLQAATTDYHSIIDASKYVAEEANLLANGDPVTITNLSDAIATIPFDASGLLIETDPGGAMFSSKAFPGLAPSCVVINAGVAVAGTCNG